MERYEKYQLCIQCFGYLIFLNFFQYQKTEVHNLGRFISVMKFRPLVWRESHSYMVADRIEDLTSNEDKRVNPNVDPVEQHVVLFGKLTPVDIILGVILS